MRLVSFTHIQNVFTVLCILGEMPRRKLKGTFFVGSSWSFGVSPQGYFKGETRSGIPSVDFLTDSLNILGLVLIVRC